MKIARIALAIMGAALLGLGAYSPLVSMHVTGYEATLASESSTGVALLLFAGALGVAASFTRYGWVTAVAAALAGGVVYTVWDAAQVKIEAFANNPMLSLLGDLAPEFKLEWGWAVLSAGVLVSLFSGLLALWGQKRRKTP